MDHVSLVEPDVWTRAPLAVSYPVSFFILGSAGSIMKILVVGGAGAMASGTVRDLTAPYSRHVDELVVADTSLERAQALVREIGDGRLKAAALDVTDGAMLRARLEVTDLCINAVPTFAGHQMAIFDACFDTRTTYVDYGGMGVYTVKQKEHHRKWQAAGLTAVLGLGADPGISNVICKAVAERLDHIDRINLYWAAKKFGPESPVLVPPYAVSTVLGEYANPSRQFLDGALRDVSPLTGHEVLTLPEPWGPTEFMFTQHSEPLTVPFADGIRDKGIREFTWKLHLPEREHEAWVGLVKAGFGDFSDPIAIDGASIEPARFLEAVIRRNIERHGDRIPETTSHELHLAIGEGERGGKPCTVNCAVIGSPDPLYDGYVDAGTSMGLSIGVQLIGDQPRKPGVWGPEEYFEVASFLAELERRRFKVMTDITVERAG
jgi:saccharopine dehydrogenase-like NADP-dependent oxidoreductase